MDGSSPRPRLNPAFFIVLASLASAGCRQEDSRGQYLESRPPRLSPVGERCAASSANGAQNQICLALHYVVYNDDSGKPVIDAEGAAANVRKVNEVFAPCGIAFQIDNFEPVNPADAGLTYNTASFEEMDQARRAYGEQGTLLAITTGAWAGSLRAAGANAWTQPPLGEVWGVVQEAKVADYSNILAHELGHYLNLDHVSDNANLLNPIVYLSSKSLTPSQCETMRNATGEYWAGMIR